jgi:putative membrane protein
MMGFGLLFVIGFGLVGILLVVGLVVYLLGWRPQGNQNIFGNSGNQQAPLEILKARYARGEISQQEFEQMRDDLLHKN